MTLVLGGEQQVSSPLNCFTFCEERSQYVWCWGRRECAPEIWMLQSARFKWSRMEVIGGDKRDVTSRKGVRFLEYTGNIYSHKYICPCIR
jgi:hypothetical protein